MAGILKVDQIQNTAGVQIMDLQNDNLRIWNGSSYAEMSTPGALIGIKTYTSQNGNWADRSQSGGSGTWTKPSGCGHVLVYVTGGGGGARCNDNNYRGGGGGAGATTIKYIDVSSVNSVNYTYGGGGSYVRNGGRAGSGGTSSFGSYCTASGGSGGYTDNPYEGGRGGDASGGDINLPGGPGSMSHGSNNENVGGMSFWHKAGSHHHNENNGAENTHGQWGSGGGHGYYSQNSYAYGNSNGGAGCVIIWEYT